MKDGLHVVAIVPARGGTDTVPYLNIKKLGDRALLAHTLDAAQGARSIDRLIVSTDDEAVVEVARRHGAEVPFLRPAELAADIPSLQPVDVVVVLQATTPFRPAEAIEAALDRLVEGGFDSVISVTEDRTLNWHEREGVLVP